MSELDGATPTPSDGDSLARSPGPIRTTIDVGTALAQAEALLTAAEASPVRQFRYELRRRGVEWQRAARLLEGADIDEAAIELAGSVTPGMKVPVGRGDEWGSVVRQLTRDGQLSLHVEDPMGRPIYLNYVGPSSPVVVRW